MTKNKAITYTPEAVEPVSSKKVVSFQIEREDWHYLKNRARLDGISFGKLLKTIVEQWVAKELPF